MNQDGKKIIKIASLSVFFIFIMVYGFFVSKDLIFGIKIKDVNLTDGLPAQSGITVSESVTQVAGNARNAINLTLNGREISVDEEGSFNETIALLSGYNIISLKAQDKFGYIDEKNYKLIHIK